MKRLNCILEINFEKWNFIPEIYFQNTTLVIISKAILRQFGAAHPEANDALNAWYAFAKAQDWKNLAEVRETVNSVDYVGNDRYVFNLRGNRYRLIVMIFFDIRTIYIRFIGTHAEYDKIDAKTI